MDYKSHECILQNILLEFFPQGQLLTLFIIFREHRCALERLNQHPSFNIFPSCQNQQMTKISLCERPISLHAQTNHTNIESVYRVLDGVRCFIIRFSMRRKYIDSEFYMKRSKQNKDIKDFHKLLPNVCRLHSTQKSQKSTIKKRFQRI